MLSPPVPPSHVLFCPSPHPRTRTAAGWASATTHRSPPAPLSSCPTCTATSCSCQRVSPPEPQTSPSPPPQLLLRWPPHRASRRLGFHFLFLPAAGAALSSSRPMVRTGRVLAAWTRSPCGLRRPGACARAGDVCGVDRNFVPGGTPRDRRPAICCEVHCEWGRQVADLRLRAMQVCDGSCGGPPWVCVTGHCSAAT